MPRYIISIGSNSPSRHVMVEEALLFLPSLGKVTASSRPYSTPDAYHPDYPPYANAIAIVESELAPEPLNLLLKQYEEAHLRDHSSKLVTIDLDLVVCDSEILRPRDFNAPYFVKGLTLLSAADSI